jgi:glycosyltransferase involved in cell wall biosynthesis
VTGEEKPIDVYCRATLYKGWTRAHRTEVIERLNRLPKPFRVVSSVEKVGFSEYYREMRRSKIFVSPSGWCELTPKDYEAMYFGALLVKPCVEHIDTHPDILFADDTYVPVKWDLSDLEEKCQYYLEHPEERRRIAGNAREAFVGYFERKEFLDKAGEVLDFLGLGGTAVQPPLRQAVSA